MTHKNMYFILIMLCILAVGLILRLNRYDSIPAFDTAYDEVMYPWAGMSLLQTGIPTSWSGISSYKNKKKIIAWDRSYTLVTPWVHKPLLYPVLTGGIMMLSGAKEFDQVRFTTLRLIPIAFSTLTILLIAIAGTQLFNQSVGIVASLLYATVPTIVISGRLSVIENALTPVVMLALLFSTGTSSRIPEKWHPYILGFLSAIAILLKQTGIFLSIACIVYYLLNRRFKDSLIVALLSAISLTAFCGIGWYYVGLDEFLRLNLSLADYHTNGAPQLVSVLFRYPMISFKGNVFVDPYILAGYILLFSAPFWLPNLNGKPLSSSHSTFLMFPFLYFLILQLAESGSARYFGWHFYPIFPFICILLGIVWDRLYLQGTFLQLLSACLIITPIFIWIYKLIPSWLPYWQILLIVMFIIASLMSLNRKLRCIGLIGSLLLFVVINSLAICTIPDISTRQAQPFLIN